MKIFEFLSKFGLAFRIKLFLDLHMLRVEANPNDQHRKILSTAFSHP